MAKKPKKPPRWPKTQKGWVKRWQKSLEIVRERLTLLLYDRDLYLDWRKMIGDNPDLDPANEFFNLIHRAYWNNLLIGIRSFDDQDRRSHSLLNLMEEIRTQAAVLDRTWFLSRYRNESQGEYQFNRQWSGKTSISPGRVQKDIWQLKRSCAGVRKLVNKVVAHNGRRRPRKIPTYGEVSAVLDDVYELVNRYNALLFNSGWGRPVDMTRDDSIFDQPWRKP